MDAGVSWPWAQSLNISYWRKLKKVITLALQHGGSSCWKMHDLFFFFYGWKKLLSECLGPLFIFVFSNSEWAPSHGWCQIILSEGLAMFYCFFLRWLRNVVPSALKKTDYQNNLISRLAGSQWFLGSVCGWLWGNVHWTLLLYKVCRCLCRIVRLILWHVSYLSWMGPCK